MNSDQSILLYKENIYLSVTQAICDDKIRRRARFEDL
jgi:hypothetical protein